MRGETFGELKQAVYDAARANNEPDRQAIIDRTIRRVYIDVCKSFPLHGLRAVPLELDFSSTSYSDGILLPCDMFGIELVWDDDNNVIFHKTDEAAAQSNAWGYRYYTYRPSRTALFRGTDLRIAKGGTSFVSTELSDDGTDMSDEYVRFESDPGYYKISSATSPFTFAPTYYGKDVGGHGNFQIRPPETERMILIDGNEDKLKDRTVDVYWWRAPLPLYNNDDEVLLPYPKYLELLVLRETPSSREYRPVSQGELEEAKRECLRRNPELGQVLAARDKHGNRFSYDTSPFDNRAEGDDVSSDRSGLNLTWS